MIAQLKHSESNGKTAIHFLNWITCLLSLLVFLLPGIIEMPHDNIS